MGLPAVVGYLLLGLAVSPFTPGYVADRHQIELLADVGVVLLLFEVGIEVIAEDPTTAEVRRRLLPFRDVFAVLFFVAIGMLLDPAELTAGLPWVGLFVALIVVAKVVLSYGLVRLARLPGRPLQVAVGLGQVGEFSFVLGSALLA